MDELLRQWGANIKAAREAAGLSQKQLAEEMEVSWPTMSRWESGFTEPKRQNKARLARILGKSAPELFPVIELAG